METNEAPVETTTTTTESQTDTQPQVKQAEKKSQTVKQQIRKFKLKVNGQQRQVDQATAIALAQKGFAADEKFQKTANQRKKIERFMEMAKANPDQLIKQLLGQDAVQFSKKRLSKELQELTLTPQQKQLRDAKRKLQAYENEKKQAEQKRQAEAQQAAVKHWNEYYDKHLPQAIKKAGLPLTEDVIKHATDIMIANLEQGLDLPMEAVMEFTKQRYIGGLKKFFGSVDPEKLSDFLGEQIAGKLGAVKKKAEVKKSNKPAIQQGSSDDAPPKSQYQRMKELQEKIKRWSQQ